MLKFYGRNTPNGDYIELPNGSLDLKDAYSCVWEIVILCSDNDDENKYKTCNGLTIPINDSYWIDTRRNFISSDSDNVYNSLQDVNEKKPDPTLILYIGDNTTKYERYQYYTITNNNGGDFDMLTIMQPECNFEIITETDDDIVLDSGVETSFRVTVYGASKNINIFTTAYSYEDDDIVDIDDIRFSYDLIEKNERYNVYEIKIMYYGTIYDYDDDEPYYYTMNIVHQDNITSTKEVIMRPIFIPRPSSQEITNSFDNEWKQQVGICTTKNDKNKLNFINAKCEFNTETVTNPLSARIMKQIKMTENKDFTPLTVLSIDRNVIKLKSCNALGENDSALIIKTMASWCFYDDLFTEDNEHIITIKCMKNIYGGKRRSLLTIKNAETNFGIIQFNVTQDEKDDIYIKSIKSVNN